MADIPLIGANVSLKDGKDKSLNPTIKRVNELDGDFEKIETTNQENLNAFKKKVSSDIKKVDDKVNLANEKATEALANSQNTQTQLDTVIDLSGTDADPRVSQALIDVDGKVWATLKARLDTEQGKLLVDNVLWTEVELLASEFDALEAEADESVEEGDATDLSDTTTEDDSVDE